MNKLTRFVTGENVEDEGSPILAMPEVQSLSWDTRIKGFAICFLIGALLGVGSIIVFWAGGNLIGFAVLYTFANILSLGSTIFLMGPLNQLKKMFAETRIFATIVFLICLIMTLVSALAIKNGVLVFLFIILQFLSLAWYTLSYIPFARRMPFFAFRNAVKSCCQGVVGV